MKYDIVLFAALPPDFKEAFKLNAFIQLAVILFASIILDGGIMAAFCMIVVVVYWLTCGFVLLRRHSRLTPTDLRLFRWGFVGMMVLGAAVRFTANLLHLP